MTGAANKAEEIFRSLDRELWVVTSATQNDRGGLLATWVSQASLNPQKPVILVGLAPNHHTTRLVRESGKLAVHLLDTDQADVAWNFCRDSGKQRDKLANIDLSSHTAYAPILARCHSFLLGRVFACVETGERSYFWADIFEAEKFSQSAPLCERQFLQGCDDEQIRTLKADKQGDIALQTKLEEEFRESIPEWLRLH